MLRRNRRRKQHVMIPIKKSATRCTRGSHLETNDPRHCTFGATTHTNQWARRCAPTFRDESLHCSSKRPFFFAKNSVPLISQITYNHFINSCCKLVTESWSFLGVHRLKPQIGNLFKFLLLGNQRVAEKR